MSVGVFNALAVRLIGAACAILSTACAVRHPALLVPETDPEVKRAVRAIPPGGSAAVQTVDQKPDPSGGFVRGAHFEAVLEGVIGRDGRVRIVSVERENDPAFTRACIRATVKWRYKPTRGPDGKPVAMWSKFACTSTIR